MQRSILIIDDHQATLRLYEAIFESENCDVITAQGGTKALQLLSQIKPPNLILLDFQMFDMTGSEFLIELEKVYPQIIADVPIVFLTGMDEVPQGKACGFIRKTGDLDELVIAVNKFLVSAAK